MGYDKVRMFDIVYNNKGEEQCGLSYMYIFNEYVFILMKTVNDVKMKY